ncbi:1-deoxy-D-xylulose-5-phosphate reductoisomerase [bacterium]|nr:1-deoxy-D-xylulose-5-phosphate reductoisomerase [bacterium]
MKKISILGSTGSIGTSTLDVVAQHSDMFCVVGLAEGHDYKMLFEQIKKFEPEIVSVRDEESAKKLKELEVSCKVVFGIEGACEVASIDGADLVVSAIVGAAGLKPTYAAMEKGKQIALANKETMVIAGSLMRSKANEKNIEITPIDSEHSAIFQSMVGHKKEHLRRIILTASGGPFRNHTMEQLQNVTKADALKHPSWSMGAKITIDSASMMNKGLEVIEARWLFDVPAEKIDVHIHPQSIVHSAVEYIDGCVIAQLGVPDMRAPIAYALSYPERITTNVDYLDLTKVKTLEFFAPDLEKFRLLKLAYEVLEEGGIAPIILNAANEIAVAAFLDEKIKFLQIAEIVEKTLNKGVKGLNNTIDEIVAVDRETRCIATELLI